MESTTKTVVLDSGESVRIPRLNLEDLFSLGDEITAQREKDAEALGRADKLEKLDITNLKLDLRIRKVSVAELHALCGLPHIASKVARTAMTKGKLAADLQATVMDKLSIPDALELARMLVLDEQEEPVKDEETKSPLSESGGSSPSAAPNETAGAGAYATGN